MLEPRLKSAPDDFEIVGKRGFFRPLGCVPLEAAVQLIVAAISYAREQGLNELMVNAALLTGFPSPTLSERYDFVEKWARAAGGALRISMVVHEEMIDLEKFGITVALNRGLVADVFASESAAIAWLDGARPDRNS